MFILSPGYEKSSIWLLRMMPVEGDMISAPKMWLTVLVTATALPDPSTTERCAVPWSATLSNT